MLRCAETHSVKCRFVKCCRWCSRCSWTSSELSCHGHMSCWWQLLTHRASVQQSIVTRSIARQVDDGCRDPVAWRAVTTSMHGQRSVFIARSVSTRRHDNEPKSIHRASRTSYYRPIKSYRAAHYRAARQRASRPLMTMATCIDRRHHASQP